MDKAEWPKMKKDIVNFGTKFLETYSTNTLETNWQSMTSAVHETIDKNIPSRMSTSKPKDHPWISTSFRRKCRKKHRMYNAQKNSSDPSAKTKFRLFKKLVEKEAKKKRIDYITTR